MSFVHISDLHLSDPGPCDAAVWSSPKRLLAWNSWRRKRQHRFDRSLLDAAARAIGELAPAATLITGDLTQLGLPREFEQARDWLPRLGDPENVCLVPGNHDAQRREPWAKSLGLWESWLGDDIRGELGEVNFPGRRRRGGAEIFGVSTACPSLPTRATGRIGPEQLARLDAGLSEAGRTGVPRILLLHHPPVDGIVRSRKRLLDAPALRAVLDRTGVELILHGHAHEPEENAMNIAGRSVPVIGAPALAEWRRDRPRGGRFHRYRFGEDHRVEMWVYDWNEEAGTFVAGESRWLGDPRA